MAKIEYTESAQQTPTVRVTIAVDLAMAVSRMPGITPVALLRCLVAAHRWDVMAGDGAVSADVDTIIFGEPHGEFARLFGVAGWNVDDVGFDPDLFEVYPTSEYLEELLAGAEASTLDPHAPPSTW
jgi:hypothetical protein